jgi:hypothetical protein
LPIIAQLRSVLLTLCTLLLVHAMQALHTRRRRRRCTPGCPHAGTPPPQPTKRDPITLGPPQPVITDDVSNNPPHRADVIADPWSGPSSQTSYGSGPESTRGGAGRSGRAPPSAPGGQRDPLPDAAGAAPVTHTDASPAYVAARRYGLSPEVVNRWGLTTAFGVRALMEHGPGVRPGCEHQRRQGPKHMSRPRPVMCRRQVVEQWGCACSALAPEERPGVR